MAQYRTGAGGDGIAPRRPTSTHEVEKALLFRISSGAYATNQRLPTCEQLASELGVNKNTVSKAYRSLAERGYLHTTAGRGTFVIKRPVGPDPSRVLAEISNLLALVVQQAKLAGIGQERFQKLVAEITGRFYDSTRVRVGYVECNRLDAALLSRDLQVALSHPVEPLLLDEVTADPDYYVARFAILGVNLTHLLVLEEALRARTASDAVEIIPLLVPPDPESLTQVARLRQGTRLGIVCDLSETLEALSGLVRGYNPGVVTTGRLTSDEPGLQEMLASADVVLVTSSASTRLQAHELQVPVITVMFTVDERSVQQLAGRIAAWVQRELPAAS